MKNKIQPSPQRKLAPLKPTNAPEPQPECRPSPPPTSNAFRLQEELRQLKYCKHRHHIALASENRVEIIVEFELGREIIRGGLGENWVHFEEERDQTVQFLIVLHEMYPWCAPFLVCATQVMFPRLDDYRDYLEDVLESEWWPNITACDIMDLLPNFLQTKLQPRSLNPQNPPGKRSFSESLPHSLTTISHNCKGIKLSKAEYYNKQLVLMGKYENIVLGISWSDFVVFRAQRQRADRYYIEKKWAVRQIRRIKSKKISSIRQKIRIEPSLTEKYQFCLELMNGRKEYIKMEFAVEEDRDRKETTEEPKREKEKEQCSVVVEEQREREEEIKEGMNEQEQESNAHIKVSQNSRRGHRGSVIFSQQLAQSQKHSESPKKQYPVAPPPLTLPQHSPSNNLTLLRHISQYIQLRQHFLGGQQPLQTKIRMLSQVMQNASQLEEEVQLQLYYRQKLKEIINSEFGVSESDAVTSKFQFDI